MMRKVSEGRRAFKRFQESFMAVPEQGEGCRPQVKLDRTVLDKAKGNLTTLRSEVRGFLKVVFSA